MGAAVVVISARREKELVALFRSARATSAAEAQSLAALGAHDGIALRRLQARAVIREGGPGTYYLDEPSWLALNRLRQRMLFVVLLLALAIALVAFIVSRGQASSSPPGVDTRLTPDGDHRALSVTALSADTG